jgi:16S rRNA processing protein RimM
VNLPAGDWVAIALLGKPRGNRGEVTALALSGKPERYQTLETVYLWSSAGIGKPAEVESAWFHDGTLVLKFRGVDSISEAEELAGVEVLIPASERAALEPGEYFQSDLVGCEVRERGASEALGRVAGWEDSGGTGLLVLESGLLIPFARAICREIDTASKRILVDLPEGLKDLNRT